MCPRGQAKVVVIVVIVNVVGAAVVVGRSPHPCNVMATAAPAARDIDKRAMKSTI